MTFIAISMMIYFFAYMFFSMSNKNYINEISTSSVKQFDMNYVEQSNYPVIHPFDLIDQTDYLVTQPNDLTDQLNNLTDHSNDLTDQLNNLTDHSNDLTDKPNDITQQLDVVVFVDHDNKLFLNQIDEMYYFFQFQSVDENSIENLTNSTISPFYSNDVEEDISQQIETINQMIQFVADKMKYITLWIMLAYGFYFGVVIMAIVIIIPVSFILLMINILCAWILFGLRDILFLIFGDIRYYI
jgi:hypothetical protein